MVAFHLWDHLGRRVTPMLAVYASATVVMTVAAGTRYLILYLQSRLQHRTCLTVGLYWAA